MRPRELLMKVFSALLPDPRLFFPTLENENMRNVNLDCKSLPLYSSGRLLYSHPVSQSSVVVDITNSFSPPLIIPSLEDLSSFQVVF